MSEEPIIRIKNLNKIFTNSSGSTKALTDVSLDIEEGEIFGIIGMSGSGKSTLAKCINLLVKPTDGRITVIGRDMLSLDKRSLNEIRHSIGMIFQQFNLLMQYTAIQNICFPLEIIGTPKQEAEKRAMELLKIVGLQDKADSYPSQLSGGQKQRIAIARALATKPKVLLCDEATSALDPTTTRAILALLKEINIRFGITIVIITHQMEVIEAICQKVAILDHGMLVEHGTVEEIFTRPKSDAAQKLVFPDGKNTDKPIGRKCCRIIFNGNSSSEPIISDMVMACRAPINIIYANTKNVGGKAFGEIVIQLPENELARKKIISYLQDRNLETEEMDSYV